MKGLKLFIWTEFEPDYAGGLAFALAPDEIIAKKMIQRQRGYPVCEWGNLEIRRTDVKVARSVDGGS